MNPQQLDEIIACLPQERTPFHYFRDRYALMLLGYVVRREMKVAALRASPFGRLLDKSVLRSTLDRLADGKLRATQLDHRWPKRYVSFLLTVGRFGGRYSNQTSRPGYNLVLQLNFTRQHDRPYTRLVKPRRDAVFNYRSHPILRRKTRPYFRETLAWSRLDINLATSEAVIEEIQSDWVRQAQSAHAQLHSSPQRFNDDWEVDGDAEHFTRYMDKILAPYLKLWDEAMLAASIAFLREELGIQTIYYHTNDTGYALKGIQGRRPPRSLYTDLPRRFCFQEQETMPSFLHDEELTQRRLRRVDRPRWFVLQF